MDMDHVLPHHLMDIPIAKLFAIGGVDFVFTKHLLTIWIVCAGLVAFLSWVVRGTSNAAKIARHAVEVIALYLRDEIIEPLLGHDTKKYLHYFLTLFFFILTCNYVGLVPWSDFLHVAHVPFTSVGGTVTANVSVTLGLALCTLGFIVFSSIRALGIKGFVSHFMPVPHDLPLLVKIPLYPLMFLIEVIGLVVKIFALTVRLFANMIAGHIVILGFFSLIFIIGAVSEVQGLFVAAPFSLFMVTFVNCIELLVGLLQAFIFTLLTAVFVGSMLHAH
ncbi:MAG: ATP synthase F0 subunit A [Elusimicrobia bacterium]|nr:MAG: ATP synthase F0 subunit A [Elusimicrobiota bacterium]